jgi:hypothetical protein
MSSPQRLIEKGHRMIYPRMVCALVISATSSTAPQDKSTKMPSLTLRQCGIVLAGFLAEQGAV